MKAKKYFLVLGLAVVVAMVANFMVSESETQMDALALANVEALANGEGSGACSGYGKVLCSYNQYWVDKQD